MERKRKMPARAAARIEQAAKKGRTATPPDHRAAALASAANSTPDPQPAVDGHVLAQPAQPPPLPTAIQPGKPLPTVENAQPEDLPIKDYQSFQESGVLAESLSRSRQRWISDGLFEKFWTKPVKKKGVLQEDPKNPPKDSMTKIGQVTISLEPHYFEATMYAVKDSTKSAPPPVVRPTLQYGPPNGVMPPPPPPAASISKPPTPAAAASAARGQPPNPVPSSAAPSPSAAAAPPSGPSQSQQPRPTPSSTSAPHAAQTNTQAQPPAPSAPSAGLPAPPITNPAAPVPQAPIPTLSPAPLAPGGPAFPGANRPPVVAGAPAAPQGPPRAVPPATRPPPPAVPGTDPIIVTLAEKANEDPQLRDLMKRVANGNAPKDELARFQAIIDQITAESKRKGASQGPSAERLFVDGKTVKYFADEVACIVTIIRKTNMSQRSDDLIPPANSNPLVVELVKAALDQPKILARVERISQGVPQFTDATDLKEALERYKSQLAQQKPSFSPAAAKANGTTHGPAQNTAAPQPHAAAAPQQALRSKGPPPAVKPDVAAVVFEFSGGNGDRYLFPKFSVIEKIETSWGPQVIASFLIVLKGSASEYGGDPKLDYYQPITIRISASQPRYLDYFPKIVAPQDEVTRYMEDIMDNMTRAEYVLLAMRLPRPREESKEDGEKENKPADSKHATPEVEERSISDMYKKGLTWKKDKTMSKLLAKAHTPSKTSGRLVVPEESYQSFIASVSRKSIEEDE
ncbi:hypothetical protein BD289DRAFT_487362 [Coniella lustricola]|uniref:SWR1-complex protein 3 domain-containing protein n=1 Tax=Coniella lustricola TaxID=2025994 RepID=A0A2T2ZS46_9PEZI|nr:hypothetical protein BD289DRAFT_487362 [Coniella lustricola]